MQCNNSASIKDIKNQRFCRKKKKIRVSCFKNAILGPKIEVLKGFNLSSASAILGSQVLRLFFGIPVISKHVILRNCF